MLDCRSRQRIVRLPGHFLKGQPHAIPSRDRRLQFGGQLARISKPSPGRSEGGTFVAELRIILFVRSGQVTEKFLAHLALAKSAGHDGPHGALDRRLELQQNGVVHAGAPKIVPTMETKLDYSSRPLSRLRLPVEVSR